MVRVIEDWESEIFIDTIAPLENNPETQETLLRIKELVPLRKKDLTQWSDASLYDLRQSVIDRLMEMKIITPDDPDIPLRSELITPEQIRYIADLCAINEILYHDESPREEKTKTDIHAPWEEVRFGEIYHIVHIWEEGKYVNKTTQIEPQPTLKRHEKGWYEHCLNYDLEKVMEIRNRVITELKETFHLESINDQGFIFNPPLSPTHYNSAVARVAQLSGINRAIRTRAKNKDLTE